MKALLPFFLLFFTFNLSALSCTWTGSAANGLWNDAANWDCGQIPGMNDDVTISASETIVLSNDITLQTLNLNNATITGSVNMTITNEFTLNTGKIQTIGTLDVNGTFNWSGGSLEGGGNVNCNGTTLLQGQGKNIQDRTLNLNAGADWSKAAIFMLGNATILLPVSQLWTISVGTFTVYNNGVNNNIIANGVVDFTGSSSGEIRPAFDLSGTLNCDMNLIFRGGSNIDNAIINIAAGKRMQLTSQSYSINNTTIQGGGVFEAGSSSTVNFNSGTLTAGLKVRGSFSYLVQINPASFELDDGTFICAFDLIVPGNFIWGGGTISGPMSLTINGQTQINPSGQSNVLDGCHLFLNGNVHYQSSSRLMRFDNDAVMEIGSGVTFDKDNNQNIFSDGSNNKLINNGIWNINGSGENSVQCPIENSGTINAQASCDLIFVGGGDFDNGTISKDDASTILFSSGIYTMNNLTYNSNQDLEMIGTLEVIGTASYDFPIDFNLNSTITGSGTASFLQGYTSAGNISPGNSPGVLLLDPNLSLLNTSSINIEILDNSGPGSGYDQIQTTGNIQLNGLLNVTETGMVNDDSFVIMSCSGGPNCITGTFDNVNLPTPMDTDYSIVYGGNSVTLVRANILPITLNHFVGKAEKECNYLEWETSTEVDHHGFYLQRSGDGINFENIKFILGKGNRFTTTNYNYKDCHLNSGANYYRLKSVDNDETFSYSPLVFIQNKKELPLKLVNTLLRPGMDLIIEGEVRGNITYSIFDQVGRVVQEKNVEKKIYAESIAVGYLAPGLYVLSVEENGNYFNTKFIVTEFR